MAISVRRRDWKSYFLGENFYLIFGFGFGGRRR
jgi:hypothetical protein